LQDTCTDLGISYLYKDAYVEQLNKELVAKGEMPHSMGSTELGRIISASNGLVDGTTLQIPTSGYHTLSETAPKTSVAAFLSLLSSLCELDK